MPKPKTPGYVLGIHNHRFGAIFEKVAFFKIVYLSYRLLRVYHNFLLFCKYFYPFTIFYVILYLKLIQNRCYHYGVIIVLTNFLRVSGIILVMLGSSFICMRS